MTACKNFAKGGKAGRVITAALVATLSVGAPVVALATTGAEGGIDMLATDDQNIWQSKVSYDSEDRATYTYDGKEHGIVPESVVLGDEITSVDELALLPASGRETGAFYYYYVELGTGSSAAEKDITYLNEDAESVKIGSCKQVRDGNMTLVTPKNVGDYAVVVCQNTSAGLKYVGTAYTFSIIADSLDDAVLYDKKTDSNEENKDVTDNTFTYLPVADSLSATTVKDRLGVAIDGKATSDVDVTILAKGGDGTEMNSELVVGTEYYAKVSGKEGTAYQDQVKYITFKIEPLDLAKADVETITQKDAPTANPTVDASIIKSINGISFDELVTPSVFASALQLVSNPDGTQFYNKAYGEYTFSLSGSVTGDDVDASTPVINSTNVKVLYANVVASIQYDNKDESDLTFIAADDEAFDASKLKVTYTPSTGGEPKTLDASKYSVVYTNNDGETVSASDLKNPGDYKITVTVNTKIGDDVVANTKTFNVKVIADQLESDANVFVTFDGKNISGNTIADQTYTGEDFAEKLSILVKSDSKTFVEGTDYTVAITKDVDGEDVDVDGIVDAGDYTISVTPVTFDLDGDKDAYEVSLKVTAAVIVEAEPVYDLVGNADYDSCYVYTGETITPTFKFYIQGSDGKNVEMAVPSDAYVVEYVNSKDEKAELKDVDTYQASIKQAEGVKNFSINKDVEIVVSDAKVMADVPNTAWYAQAVIDAQARGLMFGFEGTKNFGPESEMNRAQVAVVLYRMAGGNDANDPAAPAFSDVNPWHYAYTEINWAKAVGVVSGNPDGTFAPDTTISRQQFAIMLANYAKVTGEYEAVDTEAVLAEVAGGDEVEGYARDAVAWAVANGFMAQGADVNPLGTIDRAQAATMLVRFDKFVKGETE